MHDRVALALPPLLLRVTLAVTFIWAGLGKVLNTMDIQGEDAAILANMGVITPGGSAPGVDPHTPTAPLPPGDSPAAPKKGSTVRPDAPGAGARMIQAAFRPDAPARDALPPQPSPFVNSGGTPPVYSAQDFPSPQPVRQMYLLAVMLHKGAHPGLGADGAPMMPLWPPDLGSGKRPVFFAYLVAIGELGGGIMMLLGLFTRLWALVLCGIMAAALWFVAIGPAVQTGDTVLGFLPAYGRWDSRWMVPLWNLALLTMSLCVFLSGPGTLAIDRLLFHRRKHDDHDDE